MKVAVINFSGNVGKTLIAKNLLAPRLADTPVVAIETINDDGDNSENTMKGKEFGLLQEELLIEEKMIVDIGASNVEETIHLMKQYQGSHEDFDQFILPVVPETKQQIDTVSTLTELLKIGIDPKKIVVICNKVESQESLAEDFERIAAVTKKLKVRMLKNGILLNEVYQKLRSRNMSLNELIELDDLRSKLKSCDDADEKRNLANLIGMQRLGISAQNNLDNVFNELMG